MPHSKATQTALDVRRRLAWEHAQQVLPLIRLYRTQGYGWRMVARLLNLGGIQAPRGGCWHPNAARRVMRLAEE